VDGWDGPVHKLSSNENPYPPLPSVIAAMADAVSNMHRYPDMAAPELTRLLAERYGVAENEIAFGGGSVEVAAQLIRAFAGAGDEVMYAWRSFEAYPILVRGAGATPVQVPLTAELKHDLPAMFAAITDKTRVIFVCTPNNPTGPTVDHDALHDFLTQVPKRVLVVVDEAYVHFQNDPAAARGIDLFREFENVAVLHTFSKAYGLAGLRLGYTIAREKIQEGLRKVAMPFAVTDVAQAAGVASLAAEEELQANLIDCRTGISTGFNHLLEAKRRGQQRALNIAVQRGGEFLLLLPDKRVGPSQFPAQLLVHAFGITQDLLPRGMDSRRKNNQPTDQGAKCRCVHDVGPR
jgi:histidinol-phosphate aminotransferase